MMQVDHTLAEDAARDLHTADSGMVVDIVDAVSVLVLDMCHSLDHIVYLVVQDGMLLVEHCRCSRRLLIVAHLMNNHRHCSVSPIHQLRSL